MRLANLVVFVAIPLLVSAKSASATTFSYDSLSVTNERTIQITSPNNIFGGMGQITLNGSGLNVGQSILAWCLDVTTYLTTSGSYQTTPLTTAGAGGVNPSLTGTQIGQIGSLISHGNAVVSGSADASAAIQLAIWTTEYGSHFSYAPGSVSSSVTSLVTSYLANVASGGAWSSPVNVTLLQQAGNQTLGFVDPGSSNGGLTPTPLPSTLTMMLGALSLFGFVGFLRRKQRFAYEPA